MAHGPETRAEDQRPAAPDQRRNKELESIKNLGTIKNLEP